MPAIRPFKTLFSLSALVAAGLILTACGNGVGVSSGSSTAAAVSSPSGAPTPPASPTSGSATLSWSVPTQNTDGTPLSDLAGYHIYYGTTEGAWTSTITVLDASETSYVVSGLASGTYYFTVVAFNEAGSDSPESNVGSKTI
ncbi:MAG TPA: fibronectin type III domain-containing protein [Rhizomicrobium sp.]|jgi:hypothetical protein|nr:fibronectin type III domain-containing protein [Rhizomicrobium sp.]